MKSYLMIILFLSTVVSGFGEDNKADTLWSKSHSWEAIKIQAKESNKYIFVDVTASWCLPCKDLDKYTFKNDTVANLLKEKFIPVKIQFDQTTKDNEVTKKWYADVELMKKEYKIFGLPTLLFFNPSGQLVSKEMGFRNPSQFVQMAEKSLQTGLIYRDPDAKYDTLKQAFQSGNKKSEEIPYLYRTALKYGEHDFAKIVAKDYNEFLLKSPEKGKLKKENIEFIATYAKSSRSPWFNWFIKNEKKINKVMDKNHYAQKMIDRIIQQESVAGFLQTPYRGPNMIGGATNLAEADWTVLEKLLTEKYGKELSTRNLLEAQFNWYDGHHNWLPFVKYYTTYMDKYGQAATDKTELFWINLFSYEVFFRNINDPFYLNKALLWMGELVKQDPAPELLDTYACLLYKVGKKDSAIVNETKALETAIKHKRVQRDIDFFQSVITKMKNGENIQ